MYLIMTARTDHFRSNSTSVNKPGSTRPKKSIKNPASSQTKLKKTPTLDYLIKLGRHFLCTSLLTIGKIKCIILLDAKKKVMTLWSDAKSNNYVVDIINESIYKWVFLTYVKKKKK